MKRDRFVCAAVALVGVLILAGCGDKKAGDKKGAKVRATGAAGVDLPDDLKLRTLWDLRIKKGRVEKAWVKEGYAMVAASGPNIFYLLRKQDGMNLWNCEFRKPIETKFSPAVSSDAVMIMSDERVVRIHRHFGQIICLLDPGVPISAAPILDTWVETTKGTPVIFAPSYGDGRLWAVKIRKMMRTMQNPVPGEAPIQFPYYAASRGWSAGTPRGGGHILAPVSKVGGFIYVCTTNGYVLALKDSTGKAVWRIQTQGVLEHGVCIYKDLLFFGSSDFKLYCHNRLSRQKLWEVPTGSPVINRPIVAPDGKLVVCMSEGQGAIGVDVGTGKRLWTYKQTRRVLGIGEKAAYVVGRSGNLVALNRKSGKPVWRSAMGGFRDVFPCVEQFEQAEKPKPLYLMAVTGANEIVCLVEPDFKPERIREEEQKPAAPKVPVFRGKAPAAGGVPPAGAPNKN
jgi:outer membrane protein assembly factor BamB